MAIEVPDWFRTVALVGQDEAGDPHVVLLDSTGAIMAVMKGEYAGTLKNIAVDASGRVIMIPTDPADVWGNAISMGNAELTAALTPCKRFDRRGHLFWWSDFEAGLGEFFTENVGTGSGVIHSSATTYGGKYSCKITGGSDSYRYAAVGKIFPYPRETAIGIEIAFTWHMYLQDIQFQLWLFDGTNAWVFHVKLDHTTHKAYYLNSAGGYTEFATIPSWGSTIYRYAIGKLVVDFSAKEYLRFLLNENEYDLSGISIPGATYPEPSEIGFKFKVTSQSGQNAIIYVDNMIITQKEPA